MGPAEDAQLYGCDRRASSHQPRTNSEVVHDLSFHPDRHARWRRTRAELEALEYFFETLVVAAVARRREREVEHLSGLVDIGGGTFLRGKEAILEFFTKLQVTGFGPEKRKFEFGEQRPALICGDLALTSTRSRDGSVTSEVARRQADGTWLWVIDRYSVSW